MSGAYANLTSAMLLPGCNFLDIIIFSQPYPVFV